jgi:hypothetical protein
MASFSVLAIMSFCCSTFTEIGSKITGALSSKNEPANSPGSVEPANNEPNSPETGEDYVFNEGGFQFTPIRDWEVNCTIGIIQMKAPDADPENGPAFLIMAGDNPDEMTTEEAFEKFQNQSTGAEIGKPKKVKVGGFPAMQAELTSTQGDIEIQSLVLTSMLTPNRQFTMMAMAPRDRWKGEVAPYFDDVLKSIKFISPVPGAGCPGEENVQSNMDQSAPPEPQSDALMDSGPLSQYAVYATASSQYGSDSWSAMQATGAPNVENCEDSVRAWASVGANTKEWIELTYATPVFPTEINIHMNYNPSQITEIQIIDVNNDAYTVVETYPEYVDFCPDVYQISLELTKQIYVDRVRILLDQSVLGLGWNEIDAVELIGFPQGAAVNSTSPGSNGNPPSNSSQNPYKPNELDPAAFAYDVSGYENDAIMGADVQYQSTDNAYVVGLISGTQRYIVSLFIPKDSLKAGQVQMVPYDQTKAAKGNTAAIYINGFLYIAESGEYYFEVDPATGKLTGTFSFQARSKDYPDRVVDVYGAVNQVPLK